MNLHLKRPSVPSYASQLFSSVTTCGALSGITETDDVTTCGALSGITETHDVTTCRALLTITETHDVTSRCQTNLPMITSRSSSIVFGFIRCSIGLMYASWPIDSTAFPCCFCTQRTLNVILALRKGVVCARRAWKDYTMVPFSVESTVFL